MQEITIYLSDQEYADACKASAAQRLTVAAWLVRAAYGANVAREPPPAPPQDPEDILPSIY